MTDPGSFSTAQNSETGIGIVLITHEHSDHLHVESLKSVMANNPNARVVTNSSVSKILAEQGIAHEVLEGVAEKKFGLTSATGDAAEGGGAMHSLLIRAHDAKHAEIFESFGQVQNTGYFIMSDGGSSADVAGAVSGTEAVLFCPGDSFENPPQPGQVGVLALPIAGPWCKVSDAIRYALAVKPRKAFPIHDGQLVLDRIGGSHLVPQRILNENGIEFVPMKEGEAKTF